MERCQRCEAREPIDVAPRQFALMDGSRLVLFLLARRLYNPTSFGSDFGVNETIKKRKVSEKKSVGLLLDLEIMNSTSNGWWLVVVVLAEWSRSFTQHNDPSQPFLSIWSMEHDGKHLPLALCTTYRTSMNCLLYENCGAPLIVMVKQILIKNTFGEQVA